jgi:hypothetical protein
LARLWLPLREALVTLWLPLFLNMLFRIKGPSSHVEKMSREEREEPIVMVFGDIYARCPKCVTDRITFHAILEGMRGGTGVALRRRIENAFVDGCDTSVQFTDRELLALGKVIDLIDKFHPRNV